MPSTNPPATDPKLPAAGNLGGAGGKFDVTAAKARVVQLRDENKRLGQRALQIAKEGGQLLLHIKAHLKHGEFTDWKEECFDQSGSSAGEWMIIAKRWPELEELCGAKLATMSLKAALQTIRDHHKPKEDSKHSVAFCLLEELQAYDDKCQKLWTDTVMTDPAAVKLAIAKQQELNAAIELAIANAERPTQPIAKLFLDSGAFSHNEIAKRKRKLNHNHYHSPEFWDRLNRYGLFLQKHGDKFDHYANLDAIGDAKLTYRHQLYLEHRYGLKPVPVLHYDPKSATSYREWLKRYKDMGHTYIGIGGKAEAKDDELRNWLDHIFDNNSDLKFHGFAVMSPRLLRQYPWTSVDAASWTKIAANGQILLPLRNDKRQWVFRWGTSKLAVSDGKPNKEPLDRAKRERLEQKRNRLKHWKETVAAALIANIKGMDPATAAQLPIEKHSSWRRWTNLYYYERLAAELTAHKKDTLFYFSGSGCQFTNPEVFRNGLCVMPTFQDVRDNLQPTRRMTQIWEARARG